MTSIKKRVGRPRKFETPEDMRKAAIEYFEMVDTNPMITEKPMVINGKVEQVEQKHKIPYTVAGFCIFCQMTDDTWQNYQKKEDFFGVTQEITRIINDNKLQGASAGVFQHQIIARWLGLVDKQDHSVGGNGSPIKTDSKITIEFVDAASRETQTNTDDT